MKLPFQPWRSAAFRMAFNYSALLVLSLLVLFAVFYVQTVSVLQTRIDRQITSNTNRLLEEYAQAGEPALIKQIRNHFRDDIYSDTEIYLLINAEGEKLIGNIPALPPVLQNKKGLAEARVIRNGREARGRMTVETLPDGSRLLVGSDINHQLEIEALFNRAGLIAGLVGLLMSIGGAFLFHRELKSRISGIQQLVAHVKQGDLSQRLPTASQSDEFFANERRHQRHAGSATTSDGWRTTCLQYHCAQSAHAIDAHPAASAQKRTGRCVHAR